MASAVAGVMESKGSLLIEAGTGVGKSFAYLVPAILAVAQSQGDDTESPRRRVVISTHTINLQEQLLEKDLPLLNSVIPPEFSAVLVKGRHNYLSLRRLRLAGSRAGSLFRSDEEFDQLRRLTTWSKESADGSLADLDYHPLPSVWDEVESDSVNCLGKQCPTYKECFYYRARRRVQNAQILIVNHALFFSDLALRRAGASILPDYDVAILDEAHNLEAVASDHLGVTISSGQIEYVLGKLYNERTNRGLLVHHRLAEAQREVAAVRFEADAFFADLADWMAHSGKTITRVREPVMVDNPLSPALVRASAGAIEWLPVARVTNLARSIKYLKTQGFWVVGADPSAAESLYTVPDRVLQGDLAVVLGAEGKGLRPEVQKLVDHPVRIDMQGQVASLNVAAAGAVLLFELLRRAGPARETS